MGIQARLSMSSTCGQCPLHSPMHTVRSSHGAAAHLLFEGSPFLLQAEHLGPKRLHLGRGLCLQPLQLLAQGIARLHSTQTQAHIHQSHHPKHMQVHTQQNYVDVCAQYAEQAVIRGGIPCTCSHPSTMQACVHSMQSRR